MRETEYVELAFWSGWVEAVGSALTHPELQELNDAMRERVRCMVEEYLSYVGGIDVAEDA
jgi:hypothetical protein